MLTSFLSTRGRRAAALAALLLGGVSVGGVLVGSGAMAQSAAGPGMGPAAGWHHMRHGPWMGSASMRRLHLAERLAGLELYLGITAEQQPQWRAFTAAALAMVPDRPAPAADAFAAIDQVTARAQSMGEQAQKLHDTTAALKAVLTTDQVGKMNELWASFQAGREHGSWHRHGPGPDGMAPPAPAHP